MKIYHYVITTYALKVHYIVFGEAILVRRQLTEFSFFLIFKQTK